MAIPTVQITVTGARGAAGAVLPGGAVSSTLLTLAAAPVPATPPAGHFYLFMDVSDGKLKAKGPSGTLTILAVP